MPKTKSVISVENVVATGNLSQSIDLVEIKDNFEETEYNPDRFPGLVFRLPSPKTSTLIFRTGKMVCTGSRSEEMAVIAINKVVKVLKKGGIKIKRKP
ncbi:MAG: TATA box-binding protein, partial [Thaumarchaeota archaeon]|nr:TATA box-binding protein [Nitrososphaerota archaeon]